jgi:hypothetical protein
VIAQSGKAAAPSTLRTLGEIRETTQQSTWHTGCFAGAVQKAQALLLAALTSACAGDDDGEALRETVLYTAPDDRDVTELLAGDDQLVLRAEERMQAGAEVFTVVGHDGQRARDVLRTRADEAIVAARAHGADLWVLTSSQHDKRDRVAAGPQVVLHHVTLASAELRSTVLELDALHASDQTAPREGEGESAESVELTPCGLASSAWGVVVMTAQTVWRIDAAGAQLAYAGGADAARLCDGVLSDDGQLFAFGERVFSEDSAAAAWIDIVDLEQGEHTRHAHGLDTPWTHLDRGPVFGPGGTLFALAIPDDRPSDSPYRAGQLLRWDSGARQAAWLPWELPARPEQLVPALGGLVVTHHDSREDVASDELYAYDVEEGRPRFVLRTRLHEGRPYARTLAGSEHALFLLRSNAGERQPGESLSYHVTRVEP